MTKSWIITLARTVKSLASKENMNFDIFKRSIGMDTRFLEGFVTVVEHGSIAESGAPAQSRAGGGGPTDTHA
jgi:hypothetical protein